MTVSWKWIKLFRAARKRGYSAVDACDIADIYESHKRKGRADIEPFDIAAALKEEGSCTE